MKVNSESIKRKLSKFKVVLIIGVRINKLCRKIEMVWKDEKRKKIWWYI